MEQFEQIEILLVEDNPLDAELTMSGLKSGEVANHITWVKDGQQALDYLFREGDYAGARGRAAAARAARSQDAARWTASRC